MGIPTLISTATASNATSVDITSGIDSTYDEYMFVFTDINPADSGQYFQFQVNATDGADYNDSLITSTAFRAYHDEADSSTELTYLTGQDQAQAAGFQYISLHQGNGSDEACAGILHLFSPSSTTYVKHFYSQSNTMSDAQQSMFVAGYINDTTAIDDIRFNMSSGNFDGVIQMYGIA